MSCHHGFRYHAGGASMRIAIVSDIHGNQPALDAVLADVARRGADHVLNRGDLLSRSLWPRETADRLMGLHLPTICGNHERQLLARAERPGGASDRYAFDQTTAAQQQWLAALPSRLEPVPGVCMVHGRPGSDLEYLLETVDAAEPAGGRACGHARRGATSDRRRARRTAGARSLSPSTGDADGRWGAGRQRRQRRSAGL